MTDYREIFQDLRKELGYDERLDASDLSVGDPLTAYEIRGLEESRGIKLAAALETLFQQVNVARIKWKLLPEFHSAVNLLEEDEAYTETIQFRGTITIPSLKDILFGRENNRWKGVLWFDKMPEEARKKRKELLLFDQSAPETMVCLRIQKGIIEDSFWYVSVNEDDILPMGLNLEQYVRLLRITRGFEGWQQAWMDRESEQYRQLMAYLPQLFSGVEKDLAVFSKK